MTLTEVLELHPGEGADAATLSEALAAAEAKRDQLQEQAQQAERVRSEGLLQADDRSLQAAEREAAQARLAADRIAALLVQLQADHAAAQDRERAARGQDTLAALRAEHAAVEDALDALRRWQTEDFPKLAEMIGTGFRLHDAAHAATGRFENNVQAAYQREEVREAGPLGVHLPELSAPLPRRVFPGWR